MRKVYLFALINTCILSVSAQTSTWVQPDSWLLSQPTRYAKEGAKGTPELFETYLEAVIFMKNGKNIDGVKVNLFNMDDLVVSKPYKGLDALYDIEENDINRFMVTMPNGSERTFLRIDRSTFTGNFGQTGFYETMTKDGAFIKRSYKEFKKAEKAGGYSSGPSRDEFVLVELYYLRKAGENEYTDFKLTKKSVSKILGKKATQAKNLMRENSWKWNNESHIVLLMEQLMAQ